MGFKAQNNKGKHLAVKREWLGKQTLWLDMVNNRPWDAPILSESITVPVNKQATYNRGFLATTVNKTIYTRMVWKSDSETRNEIDIYFSKLLAMIWSKNVLYGDCDDFACTFLEAMLLWGVDPKYLYFIQVLTKNGQRKRYFSSHNQYTAAANHSVAGVLVKDNELIIIDSNHARNAYRMKISSYPLNLKLSQTNHEVYLVHRMDWEHEKWCFGEMA